MAGTRTFCGARIRPRQVELIREVVGGYPDLSRTELAHTVGELLGWTRPSGRLKGRECLDLLDQLEEEGVVVLPGKQPRRPLGSRTRVPMTLAGDPREELVGEVGDIAPILLERVKAEPDRLLFRELIGRHHLPRPQRQPPSLRRMCSRWPATTSSRSSVSSVRARPRE